MLNVLGSKKIGWAWTGDNFGARSGSAYPTLRKSSGYARLWNCEV